MDHSHWTPNKNKMNCDNIIMLSPITKTPVRQNDGKLRSSFQNSTSSFSMLPNHITPPSGLTKFIARNPFDADLTNKLHISVISPTVFSKISSPAQRGSPGFTWSIDEIALMQPAKIDEYPMQQMHCSDPEIEKNAQEAISRFFSENQIIPSPCDFKSNLCKNEVHEMHTPVRVWPSADSAKELSKSKVEKKDCWTQTVLTLPPELPPNVEEALKPYFNFTQDQNEENEEANTSNSSLRRKLFANHDDSHDESNSSDELSPVKPSSALNSPSLLSPPQSGIFFHGTPLRNCSQIIQRTYGTPLAYKDSSPCDVSPISNPGFNMSCQSIKSRNKSVARLDFTKDMSIEVFIDDEEDSARHSASENICKTLFSEQIKTTSESEHRYSTEKEKLYDVTQMMVSSESSVKLQCDNKETLVLSNLTNIDKSKFVEFGRTKFSESYAMQQSNMLSGNYVRQMTCHSAQDTGYQTHSSSNITVNMDSCSTSIKQKLQWDERVVQNEDEVQLSDWRENMKNMISSTPSKFNRGLSNL